MIEKLAEIQKKIKEADAILIGASNGLSISEGYHLFANNKDFQELMPEFIDKYGIRCLLQGMGFPYESEEEKWAYWSRIIKKYVLGYEVSPQMKYIKNLIGDKPHFIITSNGEAHFEAAGFKDKNIFEIEGNLLQMQCESPCHETLYPVKEIIKEMCKEEVNGKVPKNLVPKCPVCGGNMQMHCAISESFIHDEEGAKRYIDFLNQHHNKKLVILELGIGMRNQLIKAPFMRIAEQIPEATYITINKGEVYIADSIRHKSYGLDGDLTDILKEITES